MCVYCIVPCIHLLFSDSHTSDCVSARDPYCVWDGDVGQCVSNPFQADTSGDVAVNSTRYKQNIHSGEGNTTACIGIYNHAVIHSFIHLLIYSLTHSFIHSFIHSFNRLFFIHAVS